MHCQTWPPARAAGKTKSPLADTPGWSEKLASDSEAAVKSERSSDKPIKEMQEETAHSFEVTNLVSHCFLLLINEPVRFQNAVGGGMVKFQSLTARLSGALCRCRGSRPARARATRRRCRLEAWRRSRSRGAAVEASVGSTPAYTMGFTKAAAPFWSSAAVAGRYFCCLLGV